MFFLCIWGLNEKKEAFVQKHDSVMQTNVSNKIVILLLKGNTNR